jgi:hypothetical protein
MKEIAFEKHAEHLSHTTRMSSMNADQQSFTALPCYHRVRDQVESHYEEANSLAIDDSGCHSKIGASAMPAHFSF